MSVNWGENVDNRGKNMILESGYPQLGKKPLVRFMKYVNKKYG